MKNPNILISGAGIAGPTLAYWLQRHGFNPTLVESATQLRSGGYVIDFWGTGYDVAERMGIVPRLKTLGYDVQEVLAVDSDGKRIAGFSVDVVREAIEGRYTSIARGDLAQAIYQALEGRVETLLGDRIRSLEQSANGVEVTFEHSPARRFDLVIGADGLHSGVRELAFGPQQQYEKFLGYSVAAFEAAGYRPRDEQVYVGYNQPGKMIARFTLRDDRSMFMAVCASDGPAPRADGQANHEESDRAVRQFIHEQFDHAGWESREIMAAMDRSGDLYFDRVSQIRMDSWSKGRVALIGDAAACPSLLAGEGSALAMTEGYVLAGELATAGGDHGVAFDRFEQRLRKFIEGKQHDAANFAGAFAPRTAFGLFVRNLVTRAMGFAPVAKLVMERSLVDRFALPDYKVCKTAGQR